MKRDSLSLLLKVREAREKAMRMRVSQALAEQHRAEDRLQHSQDDLEDAMLPPSATLSSFLAAAASRRTMAEEVVSLREKHEAAVSATDQARADWTAADQARDGSQRLVDRAARERETAALHAEQRESDDLSQSRTTGSGPAPEGETP